ncbi:MAG: hypothetical protein J2P28_04595 [Actinobacteria bacterium]|nr:hypothetical protein [Actinomycetota bacterium]
MSGSTTAVIVMPIVIALSLVTWLSGVFYANAHPTRGRYSTDLRTEVRGGSFQAIEGGRQLMPIPEHRPAVPQPRQAAGESYQVPTGPRADASVAAGPEPASEDQVETRPLAGPPSA